MISRSARLDARDASTISTRTGRHFSFSGGTLAQNQWYFLEGNGGFRSSGAVLPTWSVSTWENPECEVIEPFLLALCCCDAREGEMRLVFRESWARTKKVCVTLEWRFEYASAGGAEGQILDLSGSIVCESHQEVFQARGCTNQGG